MKTSNIQDDYVDGIVFVTPEHVETPSIVRLKSTEEIIAAALVLENENRDVGDLSGKETFHYQIFTELLDDVSFHIKQLRFLFYSAFPWAAIKRCEERLLLKLESLETGIHEYYKFVEARLLSDKKDDVRVAVFVLASVKAEEFSSMYLDRVIKAMAGTGDEYIHCYAEGLKPGLNDQIDSRLDMIAEFALPVVKSACLEIIEYRKNRNIDLLNWNYSGSISSCSLNRKSNNL